jgi:acyl-coenzyme A synthetase/AMP-(fatty) acid ligase
MDTIDRWLTLLLQRPVTELIGYGDNMQPVSYAQLWRLVELVRQQKTGDKGTKTAASWLLSFDDNLLFLAAFLAIVIDGEAPVLPVNSSQGAIDKLASQVDGLMTDQPLLQPAKIAVLGAQLYAPDNGHGLMAQQRLLQSLSHRVGGNHAQLTVYTSGSSGTPKAIEKPLSLLLREVDVLEQQWGALLSDCEIVASVSSQHIYGLLFRLLWPLTAGRRISHHNVQYPEQIVAEASQQRVLVSSPALLSRLLNSDDEGAAVAYRAVFSSGAPLTQLASDQCAQHLHMRPIEVFGSSETGGVAWRSQHSPAQPWQCFDPIKVSTTAEGALLIESPFILEEAQPWRMDDLVELVGRQQFIHCGRSDSVVKIAEKRVSLLDINHHLGALEQVTHCYTMMLAAAQRDEIVAVVVLSDTGQRLLAELGRHRLGRCLRQQLRHEVEPVAIPRRFRFLSRLPYNAQGKIIKQDIIELFEHE